MHVPRWSEASPEAVAVLLARPGLGDLVTATPAGPVVTPLPFLYADDVAGGRLLGHVSRSNDHWREPVLGEALVVLRGPEAYVSASDYATKAVDGRVVPTWDYVVVHCHGVLTWHDDPAWLRDVVTRLTDHHEQALPAPWSVTDAPDDYVEAQLRGIVGVELVLSRVVGKAKLSQNRSTEDVAGVVTGLRARGDDLTADAVAAATDGRPGLT